MADKEKPSKVVSLADYARRKEIERTQGDLTRGRFPEELISKEIDDSIVDYNVQKEVEDFETKLERDYQQKRKPAITRESGKPTRLQPSKDYMDHPNFRFESKPAKVIPLRKRLADLAGKGVKGLGFVGEAVKVVENFDMMQQAMKEREGGAQWSDILSAMVEHKLGFPRGTTGRQPLPSEHEAATRL